MEWSEDSLLIYFSVMKNDQSGDRARDPRHVYANPTNPAVCPILALAIFLRLHKLFPGKKQDDRFGSALRRLFATPAGKAELERRGYKAEDFGTHSCRKGAATYASSGTMAAPSVPAIHNRAGWTMGRVQDIYMKPGDAGDQFCGRAVAGLPILSEKFALLPPFFPEVTAAVEAVLSVCFVDFPPGMRAVTIFCLASVVHHHEWLRANLPPAHRLLQCPLFRDPALLQSLIPLVQCRTPQPSGDPIQATGIPGRPTL